MASPTTGPGVPAAAGPIQPDGTAQAAGLSPVAFQQLLAHGDLDALAPACRQLAAAGDGERLRQLRQRLLSLHPAPQPLVVLLANADVLLSCRMPQAALEVLSRISPAAGAERLQWLILQWRAADAALDHRRAALALARLAVGRPERLEALPLPLRQRQDGSWTQRSALELLAAHLEALGQERNAAAQLLLSSGNDAAAAERLGQALRLLTDLPARQRDALFERALEQAAAAGSWGLVSDLLSVQAALPASPAVLAHNRERRLRLGRRLDDAYGLWQTLADDPAAGEQRRQLEQQLRSPQAPGGHAASWAVPPVAPLQPRPPRANATRNPSPSAPGGAGLPPSPSLP